MSTIIEMLNARIAECESEIAACKRALAAMEPSDVIVTIGDPPKPVFSLPIEKATQLRVRGGGDHQPKQTLADIIRDILALGPATRNEIIPQVRGLRPQTNAATVSGTLNAMSKADIVKLKNKRWHIKP